MTWSARLRRIGTIGAALGVVASGFASGMILGGSAPGTALAEAQPMTLIRQELALAPDASLTITFLPPTPITLTDTIIVAAYGRLEDREDLRDAISGRYGRVLDTVVIDAADPAMSAGQENGYITITVPSETLANTPPALQFRRSGLYPVTIDIQDSAGSVTGGLLSFVDRLAGDTSDASIDSVGGDEPAELGVSIVASVTAPPAVPGDETPLSADVVAQITQLIGYPDSLPLSVSISPELIGRLDPKTRDDLRRIMSTATVLAQPSLPLEPSAAAAAGQQDLFTRWLRSGEDELAAFTNVAPFNDAWIESEPLTSEGAALLRQVGVGLLLLSPHTYATAGGNLRDYTLYSRLRNVELADGSLMPSALIEPTIIRNLVDPSLAPELAALYTAADLVAWRDQLAADFPPLDDHTVVLGLDGGGVLDAERISRMVEMVASTGAVTFTDLEDHARRTAAQMLADREATITLAPQEPTELMARMPAIADLTVRQQTVTSMLVQDAGRTDIWVRTIETLSSSSITDEQVIVTAAALADQFDAITSAIVPPHPYTFTMNGLSTNLYPSIANTSNEDLRVVIRMQSSANKMDFPAGDQIVTLPANFIARPEIPVRARSNGTFTVTLQVMAPDGVTPITGTTILKAQVNAITGLAQVLTGGGLLILLTWWVRNLRRSRRARRNEVALSGHPARARAVERGGAPVAPEPVTGTATATTGTATITATAVIVELETSTTAGITTSGASGTPADPADGGSATIADS
ncbi:MAG: hypothetical protein ABIW84_09745 [Ilumatobacteraceae bacterium]